MSQIPHTVHSYHPRPLVGGTTNVPLRISKRITATPPLITLSSPSPTPRSDPVRVRVALKTTYHLAVPSTLLPSVTTVAGQAQQAKTVLKHSQILRPESGSMCILVKYVVDGVECIVPAAAEAFMAGIEQNTEALGIASLLKMDAVTPVANYEEYEIIPSHPFLPCFAKDTTKPTCFLERINVEVVFNTDRGSRKRMKRVVDENAAQEADAMQTNSQAGLDDMLPQSLLLLSLNLTSGLTKGLRGAIDNVRDRFLIYGLAVMFPLIFKSRIMQRLRNDVRGIKSVTQSARTVFEQSRNRTFKREGGRLFNNLSQTLTKLAAARQRALGVGESTGRDDVENQDDVDLTAAEPSQTVHGDSEEFEKVLGMSMMLLASKVESGPRLKINPTVHLPPTAPLGTAARDLNGSAPSPERIIMAPLASSPCNSTYNKHEGQETTSSHLARGNLGYSHIPSLPGNMSRWDAKAIENLRQNLHGDRARTPSIIDSEDDFPLDNELLFDLPDANSLQGESLGHRIRMGYSPGLDSIISSDEDIRARRRKAPSFDAMRLTAGNAMDEGFSKQRQRFLAINIKQATLPRDCSSDFIISDGESKRRQRRDAKRERGESPQISDRQDRMLRRQAYHDEQDIIDDETDADSVLSDTDLYRSTREADGAPSEHSAGFPPAETPIARNSSMFSIVPSSSDDFDPSRKIVTRQLQQRNPPMNGLPQSGDHLDCLTGRGLIGLLISDKGNERADISTQERSHMAKGDENSKRKRTRNSFGSVISDTSYMSGIIEDS